MNIMNRITLKTLRQNKRRTIVTIIGIILSTAMIAAVSTFSASFSDLLYRQEVDSRGDWHVSLRDATDDDIQRAESDFPIDCAGQSTEEFTSLKGYTEDDSFFSIVFCEENILSLNAIKPSVGRLPSNPGEIALPEDYEGQNREKIALGQTIELPVGEAAENPEDPNTLTLSPNRTETFTVVGFLANSGSAFAIKDASYFAAIPTKNFTFRVNPLPRSLYATLSNYPETVRVQTHSTLLYYSGVYGDFDMMEALIIPIIIVGLIIFIASIMLIYNAFSISVSERSRQFGMLASIGATRKQKRNAVLFEGFILGIIAIPIGIICGIVGIGITFWAVSPWVMDVFQTTVPLQVKVVPAALIGAVLFSAITILISAWIPAKRAARTTPIDAIRQSNDIKLRTRKIKTPAWITKIFGFEGTLALKNLKRYAKRYRTTIFSLTVSIILFLSTATFTSYMSQSIQMSQSGIAADVIYTRYPSESPEETDPFLSESVFNEMRALNGVTRVQAGQQIELYTKDSSALSQEMRAFHESLYEENSYFDPNASLNVRIIGLDDQSIREYCSEADLSPDILSTPGSAIVVNEVRVSSEKQKYQTLKMFSEKEGQTLPITWICNAEDGSETYEVSGGSLTFSAYTTVRPLSVESSSSTPTILVSRDTFKQMIETLSQGIQSLQSNTSVSIDEYSSNILNGVHEFAAFNTDDSVALINELNDFQQTYGGYSTDIASTLRNSRRMLDLMGVFFYGFITLITLVAVANVFNTISTGITLRTREFAMLRSVGMTKKGFNRMIRLESVFYGLKSLLYGIPLSILVCVLMYLGLNRDFGFSFFLPILPFILVFIAIFLIVGATMLYSASKIKKMNIVSALTSEVI